MAEAFAFELKLVDEVSRAAKKAADSVREIGAESKKAQKALDFSKEIERSHEALKKVEKDPGGYAKLLKIQKELAEQRKKIAEKAGINKETFGESFGKKFNVGMLTSAAFAGELLAEGALKIGEGLVEAAHKVVEIFTEGITKAFEEGGKEEKRRINFKLSLGDKEGKEALEDIERFAKLTKFTPEQIAPSLLRLRSAGFSQKSARQTIATGADIEAAGGLSLQEYAEFAEHLKLKGGVTTKQLVGARINAPQFYKDLGKKLGITSEEAEKRASEGGKVDPQLILNMISEARNKQQGGRAGTGGKVESEDFESRLAKLKDLPNQYFKKLVDSDGFSRVSDAFGKLLEKLDPDSEAGERIMGSLTAMFEKIIGWFDEITSDNGIDQLVSGIQTAFDVLKKAVDIAGVLVDLFKKAADFSVTISKPLGKVIELGDKLTGKEDAEKPDYTAAIEQAKTADELKDRLKFAVTAGVVSAKDIGGIVNQWKQTHINSTSNVTVNGGDPETVKRAAADGHREALHHQERAANEGG